MSDRFVPRQAVLRLLTAVVVLPVVVLTLLGLGELLAALGDAAAARVARWTGLAFVVVWVNALVVLVLCLGVRGLEGPTAPDETDESPER